MSPLLSQCCVAAKAPRTELPSLRHVSDEPRLSKVSLGDD